MNSQRSSSISISPAARCYVLWPVILLVAALPVCADDWPVFGHDNSRSHVSPGEVTLPLYEQWVYKPLAAPDPAWADPQNVPVEGVLEFNKTKFDDVFHITAANGLAYFASSSDNCVYCLDQATGALKWRFFTNGPVRLAPTIAEGRAYFGSDDGYAYCVDGKTGELVWKVPGAPGTRRVLGHGKMISMWPLRTGVLVQDGIAYFTAGIFPGERIYIHAVKASDGSRVWLNDSMSDRETGSFDLSPQGYLLASDEILYVPSGRSLPAAFNLSDGSFNYKRSYSRWQTGAVAGTYASLGGSYALLYGDHLYVGSEFMAAYDAASGNLGFAWFPGQKLVVTAEVSYMLDQETITALDRVKYPELSRQRRDLGTQRGNVASSKAEDKDQKLAELDQKLNEVNEAISKCTSWTYESSGKLLEMIVTKNAVIAGGEGFVVALDRNTGAELWRGTVEGEAKGLSLAGDTLYVSTTAGNIHVFGPKQVAKPTLHQPKPATPYANDRLSAFIERAAQAIVDGSGVKRGYCVVLGSGDGRLAYEIAKRSDLEVYGICFQPDKVAIAREKLAAAGMLGTRVHVELGNLSQLPYADYFANLVVSGQIVMTGQMETPAAEIMRILKPCGGVVYLGQPAEGAPDRLERATLEQILAGGELAGATISTENGLWARYVRGPLPGAGSWTHQYGDPGNTAATSDTFLRCPLEVLWYGEPGPDKVPSRHAGNAAPLSINGRVFLQGMNEIMCFDAYNGLSYWERKIPGAMRVGMVSECSNLACDDSGLFVAIGDQCLRLDQETGETLSTYTIPKVDEERRTWKYVAVADGVLIGSSSTKGQYSDVLFAMDSKTGDMLWVHQGKNIRNNAIAVDAGRVFFPDQTATDDQRAQALSAKVAELEGKGMTRDQALKELANVDVRVAYALDLRTGKPVWETPVDLTGCAAHVLTGMASRGVLVFCASHSNGHYWPQFLGGEYASRAAVALSTDDGSLLWAKPLGYRIRPLIVEDKLIAEPWAFDLHTGEQITRTNPITGLQSPWQFERPGHHCGTISGSPNGLWFRSWSFAYYDLIADQGTEHFAGQRAGCWINMIPANGLLVCPEASSGCVCLVSIHATTVLKPSNTHRAWGLFSDPGATMPVKHLRLNFGAPGDRAASNGDLWLSYPRPSGRMRVNLDVKPTILPGQGYYSRAAEDTLVGNTTDPWIYASGCRGLTSLNVPLVGPADGSALYTVRLLFADPDNAAAGKRAFDIKLQGSTVDTGVDIAKLGGGKDCAVVREFKGIEVTDNLSVELVPAVEKPEADTAPLLCGLEIIREKVLRVGMTVPGFTLSDLDSAGKDEVHIANYTDATFNGTLEFTASEQLVVDPARLAITLEPGKSMAIPVSVNVAQKGAKADLEIDTRLVWADGRVETQRAIAVEYLGARGRANILPSADAYVSKGTPDKNFGTDATLLVDGGNTQFGDESHNVAYLRFPLDLPGKPVSAKLRIHVPAGGHTQSADSGKVRLVTGPWEEYTITYAKRPEPGKDLAILGKIEQQEWVERVLDIDLTGLKELSICLDPTGNDGASYVSREGPQKPELVVEYEAPYE